MSRSIISLLIFITFLNTVNSQEHSVFLTIGQEDIPGAKVTQTRSFTGESLYGYNDGGADLYLEYGFSALTATDLSIAESKIKIEIWRMTDPESAYGIFSVSRFRCKNRPDFTDLACQNRYQLQFCKSDYYVNIINENGNPSDSAISITVGKILAAKITGKPLDLSGYFQDMRLCMKSVVNESVLVMGRLGINNGVPDLEPYFRESGDFKALILSKSDKFIVSLKFRSKDFLEKFGEIHKWESVPLPGKSVIMKSGETVLRKGEQEIVVEIPAGSLNGGQDHL